MGIQQRIGIFIGLLLSVILLIMAYTLGILQKLWNYYDMYCVILPAAIALFSFMAYYFIIGGEKKAEHRLKKSGIKTTAKVICVVKNHVRTYAWFVYDGKVTFGRTLIPLYRIRCVATENEKVYDFFSDYMSADPAPYLKEEIAVYIDKKNASKYWVDINSLKDN